MEHEVQTDDSARQDNPQRNPLARKLPLHPKNPERVCWGCDKYCPANALVCGNGTIRTQHPVELFGDDWLEWSAEEHGQH